jgi:ParB-like nuclease domain
VTKKAPAQLDREIAEALRRKRSKKSRRSWTPDADAYEVAREFAFKWTGGAVKQASLPAISLNSAPIEDVAAFNSLVKALGDPATARKVPPLVVERVGTDYRIVDGRHRLAAANKLGFARVPVLIVEHS